MLMLVVVVGFSVYFGKKHSSTGNKTQEKALLVIDGKISRLDIHHLILKG